MAKKKATGKVLFEINGVPVYCSHSELVLTGKLVANPRNPNVHSADQIERLANIIQTPTQGFRNAIVVSNRSGFITKGHCRLEAAKLAGMQKVPVDYQDYESEAAEWADMIADNKIAELAETDYSVLTDVVLELDELNFDLNMTGYEAGETDNMMLGGGLSEQFTLPSGEKDGFQQITVVLSDMQAETVKDAMARAIEQNKEKPVGYFDNENKNGNAVFSICEGYVG